LFLLVGWRKLKIEKKKVLTTVLNKKVGRKIKVELESSKKRTLRSSSKQLDAVEVPSFGRTGIGSLVYIRTSQLRDNAERTN
jgi:hypothetical protein